MSRHFAVVGDPVLHSKSPRMHRAAYAALGLDCTYEAVRATEADLPAIVAQVREGSLHGVNVTIPHKRRILPLVDRVDASARVVGCANTLVRGPGGRVIAYNTDVPAIAAELSALSPNLAPHMWRKTRALVLGTGATARSAVVALACHLAVDEVVVRGRALEDELRRGAFEAEMTELLLRAGATSGLRLEAWGPNARTDAEVLAFVQATNVGMEGGDDGEIAAEAVAWQAVFADALALDVVYASTKTAFHKAAEAHRVRVADGRGMLARQGALAFELWFGVDAPVDVMRLALRD